MWPGEIATIRNRDDACSSQAEEISLLCFVTELIKLKSSAIRNDKQTSCAICLEEFQPGRPLADIDRLCITVKDENCRVQVICYFGQLVPPLGAAKASKFWDSEDQELSEFRILKLKHEVSQI